MKTIITDALLYHILNSRLHHARQILKSINDGCVTAAGERYVIELARTLMLDAQHYIAEAEQPRL